MSFVFILYIAAIDSLEACFIVVLILLSNIADLEQDNDSLGDSLEQSNASLDHFAFYYKS